MLTKDTAKAPREDGVEARIMGSVLAGGRYLRLHLGGRGGKLPVLSELYRTGGTATQAELLESFGVKNATLSETLSKLECKGLITRGRDDDDRRRGTVSLTEAGCELARESAERFRDFEDRGFSCLSEEEKEVLLELLERVIDHWKEGI